MMNFMATLKGKDQFMNVGHEFYCETPGWTDAGRSFLVRTPHHHHYFNDGTGTA
jgi:hypothetical protein